MSSLLGSMMMSAPPLVPVPSIKHGRFVPARRPIDPLRIEGVAVVSVVGDGLAATAEPLARFAGALHRAGIEPRLTIAGPLRLGAVLGADEAEAAQRVLHAAFVP